MVRFVLLYEPLFDLNFQLSADKQIVRIIGFPANWLQASH